MRSLKKKKAICGSLLIVIVFGLIPLVGINRISSGMNRISDDNLMLNNFAKSTNNNNNLIQEELNNVTVGDEDYLSPEPPAAAPVNRYSSWEGKRKKIVKAEGLKESVEEVNQYSSWEGKQKIMKADGLKDDTEEVTNGFTLKRKQVMKAEGLKEEDEEIMSTTIPKGMTAVKQLGSGRITDGRYNWFIGIVTTMFGVIYTQHKASPATVVKHASAFIFAWAVNLLIALWVLNSYDGELVSDGWYLLLEILFYLTYFAEPIILAHWLIDELYTWEGIMTSCGNIHRSVLESGCYQWLQTSRQRGIVATFTERLDEDNLC